MTTVYGIKNCDTVRKARRWLNDHHTAHTFHDLRGDGLSEADIARWNHDIPKDQLINKRSSTWKQLSEAQRALFNNHNDDGDALSAAAKTLTAAHPTLIKRPVLEHNRRIYVGFSAAQYAGIFN